MSANGEMKTIILLTKARMKFLIKTFRDSGQLGSSKL